MNAPWVRNGWHVAARSHEVAFREDKVVIEAQQTTIALDPARPMPTLSMDGAPNLFRGMMCYPITAENPPCRRQIGACRLKQTEGDLTWLTV